MYALAPLKQAKCTHSLASGQADSSFTDSEGGEKWHVPDKVVQHYLKLLLAWASSTISKCTASRRGQSAGGQDKADATSQERSLGVTLWWLVGLLLGCRGDVCSRKDMVSLGNSTATAYRTACTECSAQGESAQLHVLEVVLKEMRASALRQYFEISERCVLYLRLRCACCGV